MSTPDRDEQKAREIVDDEPSIVRALADDTLIPAIASALREARRQGAAEMKERAIARIGRAIKHWENAWGSVDAATHVAAAEALQDAIRSLEDK